MNKLFDKMEQYKDNIFIQNEKDETITYNDALRYSDRLKEIIPERCFVLILTKNTIGGVLNYISCVKNRIVPLLIDCNTNPKLVEKLLEQYKPRYVFMPNELKNKYKDYTTVHEEYDYTVLRTNYDEKENLYDELCMCISTSGSTGDQKLVRLSYNNIIENTLQGWDFFEENLKNQGIPIENNDFRSLVALPICYSFILLVINITILGGGIVLITEKNFFEKEFWEFFVKERSTTLYGIPYHLEILDKINFFQAKYPFFKQMVIAGGNLSEELYDKCVSFAEKNNSIFGIGYGQTEATAVISELEADKVVTKRGSIGKGLSKIELFLEDDGEIINEPNKEGELVCKGPNVALGYAKDRNDLSKPDEFNSILYTGDLAYFDEDGYFYIKGRKSRFVKVYGNRVSLDNIELITKEKYKDIDIACIGKDNNICVFINNKSYVQEIESYILDMFSFNKKVINIKHIENIPRNESGKVLYSKLIELNERL